MVHKSPSAVDEKKKEEKSEENKDKEKTKETIITFEGFEQRIEILPPKSGNYSNLSAIIGKIIYHKYPNSGSGEENKPLNYFDFEKIEEKTVTETADAFSVTEDGKKILVGNKGSYYVIKVEPDQKLEKKMPVDQMEMAVVPREEWQQLFNDAWRFERDFFYDPNMHGINWNALKEQYGKLLNHAVTRWDVNFIIGELIAEINASHTYRGGGDT